MLVLAITITGALGACVISADRGGTQYRCEQGPECPPGQECVDSVCVPGEPSDASTGDGSGLDAGNLVEYEVVASNDDAEENVANGAVDLASSDLELVTEAAEQIVGIRFVDIALEKGETIESARIQFTTDEASEEPASLVIYAQAADSAASFVAATNDLSLRALTTASVDWQPEPWPTVGEGAGPQRTPNLSALISEVTSREGWIPGGAIVFIVKGSGTRTAESFEGDAAVPVLRIARF